MYASHMCVLMHKCSWKSEVRVGCLPQLSTTLYFELGSLTELGAHRQQTRGSSCLYLSSAALLSWEQTQVLLPEPSPAPDLKSASTTVT